MRKLLLAGVSASTLLSIQQAHAQAIAQPQGGLLPPIVSAFAKSVGVNTHVSYPGSVYENLPKVVQSINYLGVKTVRDNIGYQYGIDLLKQLQASTGATVNGYLYTGGGTDDNMEIGFVKANPGLFHAVEGANEIDNWSHSFNGLVGPVGGTASQSNLYQQMQGTGLDVYGLSMGNPANFAGIADMTGSVDYCSAHTYPPAELKPYEFILEWLKKSSVKTGNKPCVQTEGGYSTEPQAGAGNGSVSYGVQAKNTLNFLFSSYLAGVKETDLYELLDEGEDPGGIDRELHFGLFEYSGKPKPAADAIHNLMAILSDPQSGTFTPMGVHYKVSGLDGHDLLLQKNATTYILALWSEPRIWDAGMKREVAAPTQTATVDFGMTFPMVQIFDPLQSSQAIQTAQNVSSITVPVVDHPVMIQMSGAAAPPIEVPPTVAGPITPAPTPTPGSPPFSNPVAGAPSVIGAAKAPPIAGSPFDYVGQPTATADAITPTSGTLAASGTTAGNGGGSLTTGGGSPFQWTGATTGPSGGSASGGTQTASNTPGTGGSTTPGAATPFQWVNATTASSPAAGAASAPPKGSSGSTQTPTSTAPSGMKLTSTTAPTPTATSPASAGTPTTAKGPTPTASPGMNWTSITTAPTPNDSALSSTQTTTPSQVSAPPPSSGMKLNSTATAPAPVDTSPAATGAVTPAPSPKPAAPTGFSAPALGTAPTPVDSGSALAGQAGPGQNSASIPTPASSSTPPSSSPAITNSGQKGATITYSSTVNGNTSAGTVTSPTGGNWTITSTPGATSVTPSGSAPGGSTPGTGSSQPLAIVPTSTTTQTPTPATSGTLATASSGNGIQAPTPNSGNLTMTAATAPTPTAGTGTSTPGASTSVFDAPGQADPDEDADDTQSTQRTKK